MAGPAWSRHLVALAAVSLAVVLQVSVAGHLAWQGVVPDLVLLVVAAVALTQGTEYAVVVGFGAGLLLDLAPPADGAAGRWALALMLVGYVAGRLRSGQPGLVRRRAAVLAVVAACSFVGTSVFALTGLVWGDPTLAVPDLLRVVATAALLDVLVGLLVVPVVVGALERSPSDRALVG